MIEEKTEVPNGRTLGELIESYLTDKVSTHSKKRFEVRKSHEYLLRKIKEQYGTRFLSDIRARDVKEMHMGWTQGTKLAIGHAYVGQLRTLCSYGMVDLEDRECERLCLILNRMKFPAPPPRDSFLTAGMAIAVRTEAHRRGWGTMALAQALQFELMLRQKDVIGEWVPVSEPGESDTIRRDKNIKWLRGLRFEEIDENLILRHTTSKRGKVIEIDLKKAPFVMEELVLDIRTTAGPLTRSSLPASGPIIICEVTGYPYLTVEFRRKWRLMANRAGIPKEVRNMDSRAGAITEATEAGADIEHVKHAATHSDIAMTQRYSRNATAKIANVQDVRNQHREKIDWKWGKN